MASALAALATDFEQIESIGSQRAAAFSAESEGDGDALAADAHGYVDDLLRAARDRGLPG